MDGYYDYHPSHRLTRSVALIGFVNQLSRAVANHISSTTGLPLRLVDDLVEHRLGASASQVIAEQGLARFREAEEREVRLALAAQPPAILALGEGALSIPSVRELVVAEAHLVYLYLSYEEAREQARRQPENLRASLFAELVEAGDDLEDPSMLRLFTERRAGYERAHVTIDAYRRRVPALGRLVVGGMVPVYY